MGQGITDGPEAFSPDTADRTDSGVAAAATVSTSGNPAKAAGGLTLTAGLASALTACGGGGGGGGFSSGGSTTPVPVTYNYTDTEAARFLLQAQFTATSDEIASVKAKGYSGWLDTQFSATVSQTGTAWLDSRGHGTPDANGNYFNPIMGDWMAWRMMMTGDDQVRKRLAFALSNMMVASLNPIDGFWPPYVIAGYWDMLNANVFGNFRTLIEEVTLNPAIGFFLNTKGNLKEDPVSGREPDENYAREVMQLFTIGLYDLNTDGTIKTDLLGNKTETYGQSDITNLARVFTGYDWNYSRVTQQNTIYLPYPIPTTEFARDRMAFTAANHSNLAVTFLGVTIPANTDGPTALKTALDTLFNHPNTAPFFSKQMIQRLVTSNPSPAYVGRVSAVFANNGSGVRGDLKAVWKAILTDSEARTLPTGVNAGKVRDPIVRFAQYCRTFPVSSTTGKWEIYDTSNGDWGLGQSPLRSPSVFNFFRPGYVPPHTAIADAGLVAPEFQIHNETTTAGYINFMYSMIDSGYNDIKPDFTGPLSLATDGSGLIDWLNLHMTANQLSANSLTVMKTAINATASTTDTDKRNRVNSAILMVMACPEYIIQK